ncbi:MAG: signal recognition particle subunit srp68 [Ramalina farinacea]|uniref:Signal recognition particle subunit SRP68 n=1 Tax=Ramalina farinacea TaxID=258253 RepID=A0AA43QIR7_9LECA|nr:signal recognition particle subunit srp68 [Ramalina farinacea]
MEITQFITSRRERALLDSDYSTYRKQLTKRLLTVRRKLQYTSSAKGKKYAAKPAVEAKDINQNHEYVHLLLLSAERAWAQAMYMRAIHGAESGNQEITGSTKRHIVSRLRRASSFAAHLVELLGDHQTSGANPEDLLEARAYYVSLCGAIGFEKQHWQESLKSYCEARLIYGALAKASASKRGDVFRDFLSSSIDPSIRYSAYQLKVPRTASIEAITRDYVTRNDNQYLQDVFKRDPEAFQDATSRMDRSSAGSSLDVPKSIQWRSRTVKLEDAATAQALAAVSLAEGELAAKLSSQSDNSPKAKAAAFDAVLLPSQDAVDATKTAIDELSADGVPQSDPRMQSLQITRTAVNYALVGWRVGRNRVLCGEADGAVLQPPGPKRSRVKQTDETLKDSPTPAESNSHQMKRLRERVVLYDATLQSLDSVKYLPGVAPDQSFLKELDGKLSYFKALRCTAIARSYRLLGDVKSALALLARAQEHITHIPFPTESSSSRNQALNLEVTADQVSKLKTLLQGLLTEHRAIMALRDSAKTANKGSMAYEQPLVQRLDTYPGEGVNLGNLVTYPPRVEPIPVKPIFLDVAYNFMEYPGRRKDLSDGTAPANGVSETGKKESKKGWFGFSR